ncbi:MAG: YggT family protein [Alphaproteobacteria bacterium]|nr:YggT family protein [Alphaproteobacteria bacterium]
MYVIASFISMAVDIYIAIIIIQVAISWLIAFDVINADNEKAQNLIGLLKKATDPVYKPIQKYIPPIGGIDITPIVVILALSFLRNLLLNAVL